MLRLFILLIALALPYSANATSVDARDYLADPANLSELSSEAKDELRAFYAKRSDRAAWNLTDIEANRKILTFIDSVEALVTYHGLIKSNYQLAEMRTLDQSTDPLDRQNLEFLVTANLLRLAHDLHGDNVDLPALYDGWTLHRHSINIVSGLSSAVKAQKLEEFFDKLAPQNQAYRDLCGMLRTYETIEKKGGWKPLDTGGLLSPHDTDPRIGQLRARLAAEGYNPSTPLEGENTYDDALVQTVILYQNRNGLDPDGHIGVLTAEALNTPVSVRISQIKANMERWRHMPDNFPGQRYSFVNIPDYSLSIIEGGKSVYHGIVIVGRPSRKTPFINSRIINMVVNPSWHVPLKIARKDILPKLRKNPAYLEEQGFVIAGRTEDPSGVTIDWKNMKPQEFNFLLQQNPGDLNSLGQLKFNFYNPFDVYMHGTPHQELFEKAQRDFSSGCVRLADPAQVGEILLAQNPPDNGLPWDQQHILDEIAADKTRFVPLTKPMPIYFLYWSVFIDDDGQPNFRKDIYGYDQSLIQQMKGIVTSELSL